MPEEKHLGKKDKSLFDIALRKVEGLDVFRWGQVWHLVGDWQFFFSFMPSMDLVASQLMYNAVYFCIPFHTFLLDVVRFAESMAHFTLAQRTLCTYTEHKTFKM